MAPTVGRRLAFEDLKLIPAEHDGDRQELIDVFGPKTFDAPPDLVVEILSPVFKEFTDS